MTTPISESAKQAAQRAMADIRESQDGIDTIIARHMDLHAADLRAKLSVAESTVSSYAMAARVIHLHLQHFCDEALPYDQMIAEAAREAAKALVDAKAKLERAEARLRIAMQDAPVDEVEDHFRFIEADRDTALARVAELSEKNASLCKENSELRNEIQSLCARLDAENAS